MRKPFDFTGIQFHIGLVRGSLFFTFFCAFKYPASTKNLPNSYEISFVVAPHYDFMMQNIQKIGKLFNFSVEEKKIMKN